jgi:hypothetical protein
VALQGDGTGARKLVVAIVDEAGQPWAYSIDAHPGAETWGRVALMEDPGTFVPRASVTLAHTTDRELHAFVVDEDGWLDDFRVTDFGTWGRTRVPPGENLPPLPSGAPLSASKRGGLALDVFAVSATGSVSVFELSSGAWSDTLVWLHALPGAPAVVVPRSFGGDGAPADLDVLVPAPNGVLGIALDPATGGWTRRFVAYGGPFADEN